MDLTNPLFKGRLWAATIVAVGITTLLSGCEPVVGTVVDKEHEEGEWDKTTTTECKKNTVTGKQECKPKTTKHWDDEDWILIVEDSDGEEHEIEVSEKSYDKHDVGAHFDEENQ